MRVWSLRASCRTTAIYLHQMISRKVLHGIEILTSIVKGMLFCAVGSLVLLTINSTGVLWLQCVPWFRDGFFLSLPFIFPRSTWSSIEPVASNLSTNHLVMLLFTLLASRNVTENSSCTFVYNFTQHKNSLFLWKNNCCSIYKHNMWHETPSKVLICTQPRECIRPMYTIFTSCSHSFFQFFLLAELKVALILEHPVLIKKN